MYNILLIPAFCLLFACNQSQNATTSGVAEVERKGSGVLLSQDATTQGTGFVGQIVTPDCFVGFNSNIQESFGFVSTINDNPVASISTINDDPVASLSTIFPTAGFNSIIDDSDVGFISTITDKEGFNSDICDC